MKNKKVIEIFSGQVYVTDKRDLVISTILGSCIAVCLYDSMAGIAGMNHYVLPMDLRPIRQGKKSLTQEFNYGLQSLDKLLSEMSTRGAVKSRMQAKIFGGAKVIQTYYADISQANVDFAESYLERLRIPIVKQDVGGTIGRKILFDLSDYQVYVKMLTGIQEKAVPF
jgi:chemotaxis protein CheD